jgi:hypothetical protein
MANVQPVETVQKLQIARQVICAGRGERVDDHGRLLPLELVHRVHPRARRSRYAKSGEVVAVQEAGL